MMDDLARLRFKLLKLAHGQVMAAMQMEEYIHGLDPFEEGPDPKVKDDIPEEPPAETDEKPVVVKWPNRKSG